MSLPNKIEKSVSERVLGAATIEEIEAELASIQSSIDEQQRTIMGLKVIQKALIIARDGQPEKKSRAPRKPREPRADAVARGDTAADRIAALLRSGDYPDGLTPREASDKLGNVTYAACYSAMQNDRFDLDPSSKKYRLA